MNTNIAYLVLCVCVFSSQATLFDSQSEATEQNGKNSYGPPNYHPPPPISTPNGVPVKYGPPTLNVEFGPTHHNPPKPVYGPPQSHQSHGHQSHGQSHGHQSSQSHAHSSSQSSGDNTSIFTKIIQGLGSLTGGGGGGEDNHPRVINRPQQSYGPPIHRPQQQYGAPSHPPQQQYGAPSHPPQQQYGAPSHQSHQSSGHSHHKHQSSGHQSSGHQSSGHQSSGHHSGGHQSSGHHGGSSSSGSLTAFTHGHSPDIKCDGWIPIPGPSIQEKHRPDSSYGPPPSGHAHIEEHHHEEHSNQGHQSGGNQIQDSYGPPNIQHIQPIQVVQVQQTYGVPDTQGHQSGGQIQQTYGAPESQGHSSSGGQVQQTYGAPESSGHQSSGGQVQQSYGAPESSSGHQSAHQAIPHQVQDSYGPPDVIQIQPVVQVHQTYGIPESHINHQDNHIHVEESHGHEEQSHSESHSESHSHGESAGSNLSGGYELPHVHDAPLFDNSLGALGIQSSGHDDKIIQSNQVHESHTSEVTSNFIGGADSYSAPPLDSYQPGKYAPSFLKQKPHQPQQHRPQQQIIQIHRPQRPQQQQHQQQQQQYRPVQQQVIHHQRPAPRPQPPQKQYGPPARPQKQYGPPPQQIIHRPAPRPQPQNQYGPPRPQKQYGAPPQIPQKQYGAPPPFQQLPRNPPKTPLHFRAPVPQGLIESIGQKVQQLDSGNHGNAQHQHVYLPPAPSELPLPSIEMNLPYNAPAKPFLNQQQHHTSFIHSAASQGQQSQYYPTHNCGKGPQMQQYMQPSQGHQSYGPPEADNHHHQHHEVQQVLQVAQSYGAPIESQQQHIQEVQHSHGAQSFQQISQNYAPASNAEIPLTNDADFSQALSQEYGTPVSSSYGPPASGDPHSHGNDGGVYEPLVQAKTAYETHLIAAGSEQVQHAHPDHLPGLNTGLAGLDFVSAQKSQSVTFPVQGQLGNYQLQIQSSGGDQNGLENPNHEQILDQGLLQSILSAIEKQPENSVAQTAYDQETDHSEVKIFLKTPEGQDVLEDEKDKLPKASSKKR